MKNLLRAFAIAAVSLMVGACATVGASTSFTQGDWVLARWQDDQAYYWPAIVTARTGDEVALQYDDGDVGAQPVANVRPFDWRPGTRVECRWSDGTFYPARIAQMDRDRYNIQVAYDDGDKEATDTSRCRAVG